MTTTAREIMTADATYCDDDSTVADVARRMADEARAVPDTTIGDLVDAISSAAPNN